ncbi:MAG TPA: ABC transporter ATP-binding protein [Tissierellaceae bacterium]|nr:ABC transporter ATP-binding protein [Tissierellaceae bacterium]
MNKKKLIEVNNVSKYYKIRSNKIFSKKLVLKAIDDVNLNIYKGETLGIVGESGCGKSTLGKCITKIIDVDKGKISYDGEIISNKKNKYLKDFRNNIQAIFQDPYSSLNPMLNIREILMEPLVKDQKLSSREADEIIEEMISKVGMNKESLSKYPHEFSGGQRQRVCIARAVSTDPEFILCDEPISALDVSIQAQIINMLENLQKDYGLTYLFIAHDLSMVRYLSDRIGVMYLGNLVEIGESHDIYNEPLHPYSQGLISSILLPDPSLRVKGPLPTIEGDLPDALDINIGCKFASRCKFKMKRCEERSPELIEVEDGHKVACYLYN